MKIRVLSNNNSRKYIGTIHIGDTDQFVQRIKVKSAYYYLDVFKEYDIKFAKNELNSNDTICNSVVYDPCENRACDLNTRTDGEFGILSIDPNALKSLIG